MRVLVIEDEEGISQFIRQGLQEAGYLVDLARDGREGLDYALAPSYDALIIDIMLPRLSGLDLLRDLRTRGRKMPVIVLTARDTVDDRVRGLDAGADDYVIKPFALSELLARLRAVLRRPPLQSDRGDAALPLQDEQFLQPLVRETEPPN